VAIQFLIVFSVKQILFNEDLSQGEINVT